MRPLQAKETVWCGAIIIFNCVEAMCVSVCVRASLFRFRREMKNVTAGQKGWKETGGLDSKSSSGPQKNFTKEEGLVYKWKWWSTAEGKISMPSVNASTKNPSTHWYSFYFPMATRQTK